MTAITLTIALRRRRASSRADAEGSYDAAFVESGIHFTIQWRQENRAAGNTDVGRRSQCTCFRPSAALGAQPISGGGAEPT